MLKQKCFHPAFWLGLCWQNVPLIHTERASSKWKPVTHCGQSESEVALSRRWLSCGKGAILNFPHAFWGRWSYLSGEPVELPSGRYSQRYLLVTCDQTFSCIWLFATPWALVHQTPLFMRFFRQEYSSGLPFSFLGDLPDPGIEPASPALQADSLPTEPAGKLP